MKLNVTLTITIPFEKLTRAVQLQPIRQVFRVFLLSYIVVVFSSFKQDEAKTDEICPYSQEQIKLNSSS